MSKTSFEAWQYDQLHPNERLHSGKDYRAAKYRKNNPQPFNRFNMITQKEVADNFARKYVVDELSQYTERYRQAGQKDFSNGFVSGSHWGIVNFENWKRKKGSHWIHMNLTTPAEDLYDQFLNEIEYDKH